MTQEEILSMKPGADLNAKVAEEILGLAVVSDQFFGYMERWIDKEGHTVWGLLKPYSEDVTAAELVVDKMVGLGYEDAIYWADFGNGIYGEAEAICKAALLAVSEGGLMKC